MSRLFWSSSDQALSSLANLFLSILVARTAGTLEFGAFAICFAIYQLGLGLSRAVTGDPTLIRHSDKKLRPDARAIVSSGLAVGVLGLVVTLSLSLLMTDFVMIFVLMAVGFPILMMVDAGRYLEFAQDRPQRAFAIDAVWLGCQIALIGLSSLSGANSTLTILAYWIAGSLAALTYICFTRSFWPSPVRGYKWLTENRDLSARFAGEYVAISGVQQSVVFFSFVFGGLNASAGIRSGQVLLGPLSILSMGFSVVALPSLSRISRQKNSSKLIRRSILISSALSLVTVSYALLASLIPDAWGSSILGESWPAGAALLLPLTLQLLASNISYGATAGLRAMELARTSLVLRWSTAPFVAAAVVVGASAGGAQGAIYAAAAGGFVQSVAWWVTYIISARRFSKG